MNNVVRLHLQGSAEQLAKLRALQVGFAALCNAIAPVVQQTRCWNRVALHHQVYRPMRERFPAMGSQMVCNAIYSVCRSARAVLQHPASPWNVQRQPQAPLPLMRFADSAPVFFDRHTLSLREGQLSMFTLDGRIRFDMQLDPADEARFHTEKLLEVVLSGHAQGFDLTFRFAAPDEAAPGLPAEDLPEYLLVLPPEAEAGLPPPAGRPPLSPNLPSPAP